MGCETWLKPEISDAEIFPPTSDVYRNNRFGGYGEVFITTRKKLIIHLLDTRSTVEAVLVSLKMKQLHSNLVTGSLNRLSFSTSDNQTMKLCKVINSTCSSTHDAV